MTKEEINAHADEIVDDIISAGIKPILDTATPTPNFSIDRIETTHDAKGRWGRIKDWLLWKTPLKRWTRKQFDWVEFDLSEELERYPGRDGLGQDPDDVSELLESLEGIKYWKKKRWENPYDIWNVDAKFRPVHTVDYIKMDFVVGKSDG